MSEKKPEYPSKESTAAPAQYRRVALRTPVRISTIDPETDPSNGRPYFRHSEETCANVSRGGAFVETWNAVSPGRRVLLEIDLPEGNRVQAVGRVAWTKTALQPTERSQGPGMGIEFVGTSPEEIDRLEQFLAAAAGDADASNSADASAEAAASLDPSENDAPRRVTPPRA